MSPRRATSIVVAFVSTAVCVSISRAAEVSVINASFEELSRILAVGEQTNGAGGAGQPVATRFPFGNSAADWTNPVEVLGWRTRLAPNGSPNVILAGAFNPPTFGNNPFITGQDGQNVFAIQAAQAGQTLNHVLQPNTRYTLDFLAGISLFDSNYFFAVSLIAIDNQQTLPLENEPGVTRLAITQGLFPEQDEYGTMQPYSLEYTTPPVLPATLVGKYIGIHMYGSDGIPRVVYDDFRLDATTIPEPGGIILMFLGCGWLTNRRGVLRRAA